jgi:aspartokinase
VLAKRLNGLLRAGTVISDAQSDVDSTGPVLVKGFATIDHVALINVEGTGMVGVHGTAAAIFSTIRDANCNVIMISQASSEHSVCFAVKQAEGERAVNALNARWEELHSAHTCLAQSTHVCKSRSLCRLAGHICPTRHILVADLGILQI